MEATPPLFFPSSGMAAERDVISEIIDSLYLTNFRGAANEVEITRLGITHILSVGSEFEENDKIPCIKYMYVDITDDEEQREIMRSSLNGAFAFVSVALKNGGRVVVHCAAGISRSATIVIGYLLAITGWSLLKSFEHVYSRRRVIWPNNGFMSCLLELEESYYGSCSIDLAEYTKWGEYNSESYEAARIIDR
jgi:dual specificity phosphatase 12